MKVVAFAARPFAALLLSAAAAAAQVPTPIAPPPAPILNPSGPVTVPQALPVPVSPVTPGSAPGSNLAGTSQVVNPPQSVFHHQRRHRYSPQ